MGSSVWELSLGDVRFRTFVLELALKNFGLKTVAWELSFRGNFTWELSLREIRLGTIGWELWLGIFGLGSLAWNLRLGILGLGNWDPEAGGTAWRWLGGPGRARCNQGFLKGCIKTPGVDLVKEKL